jgi:hypothetical protein
MSKHARAEANAEEWLRVVIARVTVPLSLRLVLSGLIGAFTDVLFFPQGFGSRPLFAARVVERIGVVARALTFAPILALGDNFGNGLGDEFGVEVEGEFVGANAGALVGGHVSDDVTTVRAQAVVFEGHAFLFAVLGEACKLGISGDNGVTDGEVGLFERGLANLLDSNVGEEGLSGLVVPW